MWCSRPAMVSWPRAEVRHLGDEVAHRPGGDEQAGLLAEQLGGALLEGVDRGVVAEDVVADLGVGHRPAHRRGWVGDGVAAQVDAGHRASIGRGGRTTGGSRPMAPPRPASGDNPGRLCYAPPSPQLDPWCSGPTCQPVTLEIAGSNPVGSAIHAFPYAPSARPDGAFPCPGPPSADPRHLCQTPARDPTPHPDRDRPPARRRRGGRRRGPVRTRRRHVAADGVGGPVLVRGGRPRDRGSDADG